MEQSDGEFDVGFAARRRMTSALCGPTDGPVRVVERLEVGSRLPVVFGERATA